MKVEIKKLSKIKTNIEIEVDKENFGELKKKVLERINKEVNIPGFRKGSAPLDLVEKRYPALYKEEFLKEAVPFYIQEIISQHKLEVVSLSTIKDVDYREDRLKFRVEVELKPEIKIEDKLFKDIKIKKEEFSFEIAPSQLEAILDEIKSKVAEILGKEKSQIDERLVANWSGYRNIGQLRQVLTWQLALSKARQQKQGIENQIVRFLLEKIKFELPVSLVEKTLERIVKREILNLKLRGVSEEEIRRIRSDLEEKARAQAKDEVKLFLILEAIAKKENLAYNEEDIFDVVMGFILSKVLS